MPSRSTLATTIASIALAAIVLLALIQLHGTIVRQTLSLAGVGLHAPVLLSVRDHCGKERWLPPALRVLDTGPDPYPVDGCERSAELLALLPADEASVLFINQSVPYRTIRTGRLAWFRDLKLMPGENQLTVASLNTGLLYPHLARNATEIMARVVPEQIQRSDVQDADFDFTSLWFQYAPNMAAIRVGKLNQEAKGSETSKSVSRTLSLSRGQDGVVSVRAEACLPPTHPLVRSTDLSGDLSGPQFLTVVFQAAVFGPALPLSDPRWNQIPHVTASSTTYAPCKTLRTEYEVEGGELLLFSPYDFLTATGDTLKIAGLPDDVFDSSRSPDRREGDVAVWVGRSEFSTGVIILPQSLKKDARRSVENSALSVQTAAGEVGVKPSTGQPRQQGLVAALSGLRELLPTAWSATLWAAAAAAPVGLLLWTVERTWRSIDNARLRRARAALIALFAFMATFAALPLLLAIANWLLSTFIGTLAALPLPVPAGVATFTRSLDSDVSAPAALCAVLMVLPIMQGVLSPPQGLHHRLSGVVAALVSVLLLIVALTFAMGIQVLPVFTKGAREMLDLLPADLLPVDHTVVAHAPNSVALIIAFGLWVVLGLSVFWTAVYWLFRMVAPNVPVFGAAWVAGLVLFLLPLSFGLSDVAAAISWVAWQRDAVWGPVLMVSDPTRWMATFVTAAFMLLVVTLVLRAFREVAARLLDVSKEEVLRRYAGTSLLFLAALFVIWPMIDRSWAEPQVFHPVAYRLMTFFQAFGSLLALLAVLAATQELDERRREAGLTQRFTLSPTVLAAVSAAFAGYLTLWNREPLAVAVLMIAGWALFRHVVLVAPCGAPIAPEIAVAQGASLGKRLVEYLAETRLLRARRTAIDKSFSEGTLSQADRLKRRTEIEKRQLILDNQLSMPVAEAKRRLFALGPGSSPLRNGYLGARAGILVALVLQLLVPFNLSHMATGQGVYWVNFASKLMVDPQYQVVPVSVEESRVLVLLGEALNAFAIWTIAGFIFGYVFHLIRGRDGFLRAAVFGAVVALSYMLSQALTASAAGLPVETAIRVAPLLAFLLIVGTLVFDGAVLQREGVERAKLLEVYGLKTSVGYLSFAGALASVQPILDLLAWIMQR